MRFAAPCNRFSLSRAASPFACKRTKPRLGARAVLRSTGKGRRRAEKSNGSGRKRGGPLPQRGPLLFSNLAFLQFPGLQQGFAGVRQTALHFEGAGKHQPAIPIFGTQGHALAGQRFRKLRIFAAVKVEVGHKAEGGHISGIAEQRLVQMFAGLIRFAEPQGETGKMPVRERAPGVEGRRRLEPGASCPSRISAYRCEGDSRMQVRKCSAAASLSCRLWQTAPRL